MRRALVKIHVWLGLTLGLLWALQGLTGAVLVFHREMDRLSAPRPTAGPMASLESMLASAAQASGGAPIVRLSISDAYRDRMEASYSDRPHHLQAVILDAASARPVGARDMEPATPFSGSATRWILLFHMSLLSGRGGEIFIGASGMVLFSSALIGAWVAWPPRRGWKAVYSWGRWRTALQRLYGWHRALGLTVVLLLMTLALTGVGMTFEEQLRPWVASVVPHQLAYRPTPVQSLGAVITPQAALNIAQGRLPDARWVRVSMPKAKEPVYTIRFHQREESRAWLGRTTVVVNASTGHIEHVYDPTTAPLSNRLADALLPLHNGELFGVGSRIVMMLAGLSLPTLYVTGVWRWLAQRRRRASSSAH